MAHTKTYVRSDECEEHLSDRTKGLSDNLRRRNSSLTRRALSIFFGKVENEMESTYRKEGGGGGFFSEMERA